MRQIVFGVSHDKVGVRNGIVATARLRLLGQRNSRRFLDRSPEPLRSREADRVLVEDIEPPPQFRRSCPVPDRWSQKRA